MTITYEFNWEIEHLQTRIIKLSWVKYTFLDTIHPFLLLYRALERYFRGWVGIREALIEN